MHVIYHTQCKLKLNSLVIVLPKVIGEIEIQSQTPALVCGRMLHSRLRARSQNPSSGDTTIPVTFGAPAI